MPGIICCIDQKECNLTQDLAIDLLHSMDHHSQYFHEWVLDRCFMGAVELSALEYKNRLLYNDKSLIGVSRGSIFNKEDLSKKFGIESTGSCVNDTKFIAELYHREGCEFVKYLNGLFSIALYDKEKDVIIFANDRYGYYPLFCGLVSNRLVFASEAKTVVRGLGINPRINRNAIPEFFAFSFLLGDKTFFEGVKKVPPASLVLFDRKTGQLNSQQYWDFSLKEYEPSLPLTTYLVQFNKLMKQSVERRVKDCNKVGIFLSGGLDSRVIAAFASETKTPIVTFTFGVKGCEEDKIATEVSEILGFEHHFLEIPSSFISESANQIVYAGDGLIRIRDSHFVSLLKKVQEQVGTVLLGTFGGDLTCRPEGRLSKKLLQSKTRKQVIDFIFNYYTFVVSNVIPICMHEKVFAEEFFEGVKGKAKEEFIHTFEGIRFNTPADIGDYWEYRNREPRYIFQASQHVNWFLESRHPFMDNDLVDFFAFRFPVSLRRKEIMGITFEDTFLQRALNLRFPSLAHVKWHGFKPNTNRYKILAVEGTHYIQKRINKVLQRILRQKLQTKNPDFRGYDQWLREGSKTFVIQTLLDPKTLARSIFKEDYIRQTVDNHMSYEADNNQIICDMLNIELMQRLFFDNPKEPLG
jgi:asparagine synthase (glutamine-hydrolysing)